ncbi:MAG TPA: cytochrome c [Methylibium sp.]|nr:cytochrome c [Methylibium sp.]
MSTPEARHGSAIVLALLLAGCASRGADAPALAAPRLGQPATAAEVARWDLNVFPDGRGLPPGRGLVADGALLFQAYCQICHGPAGRGASAEELAGGSEPLTSATPDKTIGSYWPYATTLFDFIRRAKPMGAPGSLSADEVYAISAYLLQINGVIDGAQAMDAQTLPAVRMPNRDGFVGIDARPRPR